jgi:hypothetical protein
MIGGAGSLGVRCIPTTLAGCGFASSSGGRASFTATFSVAVTSFGNTAPNASNREKDDGDHVHKTNIDALPKAEAA